MKFVKNSAKRVMPAIIIAIMMMVLLPLSAMATDITSNITINSLEITYLETSNTLDNGDTFKSGEYTVEVKWSTGSHAINAGDFFTIDIDFQSEMYSMNGASEIKHNGDTVGNMKWIKTGNPDTEPGKYQIRVDFTKAVTGTGISGTNKLFFGYTISEDDEDEEITWEFACGEYSFEFTGTNGAASDNYGIPHNVRALYKNGAPISNHQRATWAISLNGAALSLDEIFDDPASLTSITITDTLYSDDSNPTQTMSPLYDITPDFDKFDYYDDAIWGEPKTAASPSTVDKAKGYFGDTAAATGGDAYFHIYSIDPSELETLWSLWKACYNPTAPAFDKTQTSEAFQAVIQMFALYKTWQDGYSPTKSEPWYTTSFDMVNLFLAEMNPINPAYIEDIKVTPGANGGFEIKLNPEAIDGKMLIVLYCTNLNDDGAFGQAYQNYVNISSATKLAKPPYSDNDFVGGWLAKTWGSGTITAQNEGIVLKKADQDGTLISDPNTEFSLVRYRAGVEDTGHSSASSWDLFPTDGTAISETLFPDADTYFELIETTAPTNYTGISTPIYFKLVLDGATYKIVMGTVAAGVFTPVGGTSPYADFLTVDAANRVLTVKNTAIPAISPDYDAALQKWVYSVGSSTPLAYGPKTAPHIEIPTVKRGDTVTFAIRVINQCEEILKITEIADYLPAGLIFEGTSQVRSDAGFAAGTWEKVSDSKIIFTPTDPITLEPGEYADLLITLKVSPTAAYSSTLRNFAEISGMTNETNEPVEDTDSLPDSDNTNDGTSKDNIISEKRYEGGTITDPDDQDEDDHDYADVKMENEPWVPEPEPESEPTTPTTTPTVPATPPTAPTEPPTVPTTPPTAPTEPPTVPTTPPTMPEDPPTPPDDRKTGGSDPSGPVSDGIVEMNEDGEFIEFDEDGVPLGQWIWDEDEELWILDEFPPLGDLNFPETGETGTIALYLIFAAALLLAAVTLIIRQKSKKYTL